jgi:hypothetical protein
MADDPTSIWERVPRSRPARRRVRPSPAVSAPAPAAEPQPPAAERVTLREASERFGVSPSTLGSWSRSGRVDAVKVEGPGGARWMVTPGSVAAALVRRRGAGAHGEPDPAPSGRAGPTADGTAMLVPRDAWNKLMDQLGNLHQAGQQLAEARERAARAETEASFLRERLAELRTERDGLRNRLGEPPADGPAEEQPGFLARLFGRAR